MRKNYNTRDTRTTYIKNENIRVPEVRVLDEMGAQVGIMSRDEALKTAYDSDRDVIMIAPLATPPVVKMIDFKKFLYQEGKRKKEAKKGVKKSSTKDIQLSLFIGVGDFDRMTAKAIDFLKEGHQVRIKLALKGRELGKKPMAFDLMNKFLKGVGDHAIASEPKMQGRVIICVISRKKV